MDKNDIDLSGKVAVITGGGGGIGRAIALCMADMGADIAVIERGDGGSIVNVSSIEGSRAAPDYAVYAACKAGVNNLTRTLAVELAEHGIRINTIAPDMTDTPGLRGNLTGPVDESKWIQRTPEQVEGVRRRIPMGRWGVERLDPFQRKQVDPAARGLIHPYLSRSPYQQDFLANAL